MKSAPLFDRIVSLLTPALGPFMAKAAVEGQAKKLGLDLERPTKQDVERLAGQIGLGLTVFVGPEKAEELAAAIARLPLQA